LFRGADGILLETWSDPEAAELLARKVRSGLGPQLPVLLSFTFRRFSPAGKLRTFKEATPENCAQAAENLKIAALAVNCGDDHPNLEDGLEILERFRFVSDLPLFARPSAGIPVRKGGNWAYPFEPVEMAATVPELLEAGVSMIGGCCGTTPEHIAAFRP